MKGPLWERPSFESNSIADLHDTNQESLKHGAGVNHEAAVSQVLQCAGRGVAFRPRCHPPGNHSTAFERRNQVARGAIGVRLLLRNSKKVQLTPAGSAFLVEARQILERVARAKSVARALMTVWAGGWISRWGPLSFIGACCPSSISSTVRCPASKSSCTNCRWRNTWSNWRAGNATRVSQFLRRWNRSRLRRMSSACACPKKTHLGSSMSTMTRTSST